MADELQKTEPFWKTKTLGEMTSQEWESLCDGCGRCCLQKFEFDDGEVVESRIACKLLDRDTCRCERYEDRHQHVPGCILITPKLAATSDWLPDSCAYRRLAAGKDLAWWHPLVSGDPNTVHEAGYSIRDKGILSEENVHPDELLELDDGFLLEWVEGRS